MIRDFYNKSILEWNEFPEYDIVYTDPPWEQGALNMFQTMMRKQTGIQVNNDIETLLNHLASHCRTDKPVFIAYFI